MIYESPYFMGIPWETLIKLYRKKLGTGEFPHLNDYANDFISFLNDKVKEFPLYLQDEYYLQYVDFYYKEIYHTIRSTWIESQWDKRNATVEDINQKGKSLEETSSIVIDKYLDKCDKYTNLKSMGNINVETVYKKFEEAFQVKIDTHFNELQITEAQAIKLKKIASSLYLKRRLSKDEPYSGIVIAGFGEDDIFPCLESYELYYFFENTLKYTQEKSSKITEIPVEIITFGQDDMINVFIAGIDPRYIDKLIFHLEEEISKYPSRIIETKERLSVQKINILEINKLIEEIKKDTRNNVLQALREFMEKNYIGPTYDTTTRLPKRELAEMAESLVSLMSFKRKMSMQIESVADPIDVAVLSKSDGFIWIKRKHYFKTELNPQFIDEYEH